MPDMQAAEKYGNINIETIAADLSLPTAFPVVSQGLSGLDIGVLSILHLVFVTLRS